MGEEIKDVNQKIDDMDAAVKKYASKDTVISIGGYEFTPAKLMVAFTIVSSILGGLYGAFEVYKDYQSMKKAIKEYVAPDLSELNKKIELAEQSTNTAMEYTNEIKNDLKRDIRRLESVVENVERSQKQSQREIDLDVKDVRKSVDATVKAITQDMNKLEKDNERELRNIRKELDNKIKQALDNPLANK